MVDGEFDNLTVNNVLTIGADTDLYRSAANQLATDDILFLNYNDGNLEGGEIDFSSPLGWNSATSAKPNWVIDVYSGTLRLRAKDAVPNYWSVLTLDVPQTRATLQSNFKLYFGTDVNLYRESPDRLRTDDFLKVGDADFNIYLAKDSPSLTFGDRSSAWDTNLYRSAANVLTTDDQFIVNQATDISVRVGTPESGLIQGIHCNPSAAYLISGWKSTSGAIESNPLVIIHADGKIKWGAGGASATDVDLYRAEANVLATSDVIRSDAHDNDVEGGEIELASPLGWDSPSSAKPRWVIDAYSGTLRLRSYDGSVNWLGLTLDYPNDRIKVCGDLYTSEEVRLEGDEIQHLNKQEIVNKIWKFVDGMWAPEGLEPGDSFLNFKDNDIENKEKQFFLITEVQGDEIEPLLATNTGFIVQKDITAGGFVGSNQGELWLGSGRDNQVDVPKIILMHSDVSRLGGGGASGVPPVPTCVGDDEFPANPSEGDYFFHTTSQKLLYKYNGSSWDNITAKGQLFVRIGAPVLLYSCTSYDPQAQVATWATALASDYGGYFDTLYLTKFDGNPAHLDLGNLNIHGVILIGDDVRLYRSGSNQLKTDDSFIIGNYGSISSAGDAIFNSVLGTASAGLKVGPTGTTYVSVSRVGSTGYLTSHYGDLRLASVGTIWFESAASPTGTGTKNLGSASAYWNEVNAKSFPDRGCPIWIEPHEAREILKGIKPHPTLKSANKFKGKEVPQFDYSSLPEILKPNEGDGVRIEALLYTVYHVVRDLIERVETLEVKAG